MQKIIYIFMITILFVITSKCIANQDINSNENPFPDKIVNEMKKDINDFLDKLPINEGQTKQVEEFKKNCDINKLFDFINPNFSPNNIKRLASFNNFFDYFEILQIVSYNYKVNTDYSTWFLAKIFSFVKEKPNLYMESFLYICQRSDGYYAEWFADPLVELIKKYPTDFTNNFKKVNTVEKICGILETGDNNAVLESVSILQKNDKFKNDPKITQLLNCIQENIK